MWRWWRNYLSRRCRHSRNCRGRLHSRSRGGGEARSDRRSRDYHLRCWRRCRRLHGGRCNRRGCCCCWFSFGGGVNDRGTGWRRRSGWSLLLTDGGQHISGPRDVRQVNLCLDLVGGWPARTCLCSRLGFCCRTPQPPPHFFGFMFFQRTGVSFLLGYSDFRKHIENGFTLNFQFSCQIINSNFAHPTLCSSTFR